MKSTSAPRLPQHKHHFHLTAEQWQLLLLLLPLSLAILSTVLLGLPD